VPDERGPEAARVRSVSFRPRGPLSLRYQEHPHDGVPYLSEMPLVSKWRRGRQAWDRRRDAAVRVSCGNAIHLSGRTTIREAMAECGHARRSRFHSERFASPVGWVSPRSTQATMFVMPGLVPGIHVFLRIKPKTRTAGTSPAMTACYRAGYFGPDPLR
jgi:hypothetical protein